MPIYEYQCSHCSHLSAHIQRMNDEPLIHCSRCDKDSLTKLISKASFKMAAGGAVDSGVSR